MYLSLLRIRTEVPVLAVCRQTCCRPLWCQPEMPHASGGGGHVAHGGVRGGRAAEWGVCVQGMSPGCRKCRFMFSMPLVIQVSVHASYAQQASIHMPPCNHAVIFFTHSYICIHCVGCIFVNCMPVIHFRNWQFKLSGRCKVCGVPSCVRPPRACHTRQDNLEAD